MKSSQKLIDAIKRFEGCALTAYKDSVGVWTIGYGHTCYNCGPANFNSSTLKKYIESGRPTWECQEQFLRWVNAGGKKLGGLVSRRIWEAARFAD